jgi:hypothetical protein
MKNYNYISFFSILLTIVLINGMEYAPIKKEIRLAQALHQEISQDMQLLDQITEQANRVVSATNTKECREAKKR